MTHRSLLYLVTTGLTAACGLVLEIVAGRMIAPYLGMSLYTWTAVIAVVLAGFSAGHWIGGRIAERPSDEARRLIAWALVAAAASSAASIVLIRAISGPVIALGLPAVPTILLLTTLLFFLPSLFVGIPSPVLTKLAIELQPARMGRTLGLFYAVGALGSIAGTLAAGFIFISWLGSIATVLCVSAVYLALAIALLWVGRTAARDLTATLGGAVLFAAVFAAGGQQLSAFTANCLRESSYYCIRVLDVDQDYGTQARVLVLDHLGHGVNLQHHAHALVTPYVEAQDTLARMHFSGSRTAPSAFFVGGGAYTLPRAWRARGGKSPIVVAEIDPAVTEIATELLWAQSAGAVSVVHADARRALEASTSRFDIIVGDAFHDIAVPQHLVTREFFSLVRKRLTGNGIYLMNVIDHRMRPRLALSILSSLAREFSVVELWMAERHDAAAEERDTFVILAGARPSRDGRFRLQASRDTVWQRLSGGDIERIAQALDPIELTDDFAPVDRLIGVE